MISDNDLMRMIIRINGESRRVMHSAVEKTDYTGQRGNGRLLYILDTNGEMPQKELARRLDIRPQSLTEALLKLEQAGYVKRRRSDGDKREQLVSLTEVGVENGRRLRAIRDEASKNLFACLSEEEKEQLSGLLSKVLEHSIRDTEDR